MNFKECVTTKGKRCIIFYDYKYCLKRENTNSMYWTCRADKCSATITTKGDVVIKLNGNKVECVSELIVKESHADVDHKLMNDEMITVTNSIADMKLRVKNGESVKTVYTQAQNKFLKETGDAEKTAEQFPNLISIKSTLYNEQRKVYPTLPKTLDELTITDFEQASIKAFKYHFPRAKLIGCYFHFAQCLWRKFCEVGMKTEYEREDVKEWFKKIVALPLVPANVVDRLFLELLDERDNLYDIDDPMYKISDNFLDYVTLTWIDDDEALFDISLWSQYEHEGPRTNNHVEGYNNGLNKLLGSHPNIFKFIDKLKEEEATQQVRYCRLRQGNLKERHRDRSDIERDLAISALHRHYLFKRFDESTLLKELSSLVPELKDN